MFSTIYCCYTIALLAVGSRRVNRNWRTWNSVSCGRAYHRRQ